MKPRFIGFAFITLSACVCCAGRLDQVIVVDSNGTSIVDFSTGDIDTVVQSFGRVAANVNGDLFSVAQFQFVQVTQLTGEGEGMCFGSIITGVPATDFKVHPNGNFWVSTESGLWEIDVSEDPNGVTRQIADFGINPTSSSRRVEIAPGGSVITTDFGEVVIVRPSGEIERVTSVGAMGGISVVDFGQYAVDSHGTGLFAIVEECVGCRRIVHVDLTTGEVSPTAAPTDLRRIQVDALGRLVGWTPPGELQFNELGELVRVGGGVTRVDLETGETITIPIINEFQGDLAVFPFLLGLQAGDANQDDRFDQADIVQVLARGKYLTGQPATWGSGDWDGAPGVHDGPPPDGNGVFDQFDVIAAVSTGLYLTGPYAALDAGRHRADGQTSIVYDSETGEISIDTPINIEVTAINIDSANGIFTADAATNLGGSFDNDTDNNIFKATFGGSFGSISFGNVARVGLAEDFVLNDVTVVGSLAGGGDLGNVDLVYVPAPPGLALLVMALANLSLCRRCRPLGS